MPKYVDHDEHRARVVDTAIDFIADCGLTGMTFRALAQRMDCSTTAISHYFKNRTELLQSVYRTVNDDSWRIQNGAFAQTGRSPIQALEDILPVTERTRRIWRVWLCFWAGALSDPVLGDQHREGLSGARDRVRDHLLACGSPAMAAEESAEDLMQAILGIAMQALFDPAEWNERRQLAAYRRAADRAIAHTDISRIASHG